MMKNTEKYWLKELKKCKKSISYFYNHYVTINGKLPIRKTTDKDFDFENKRPSTKRSH